MKNDLPQPNEATSELIIHTLRPEEITDELRELVALMSHVLWLQKKQNDGLGLRLSDLKVDRSKLYPPVPFEPPYYARVLREGSVNSEIDRLKRTLDFAKRTLQEGLEQPDRNLEIRFRDKAIDALFGRIRIPEPTAEESTPAPRM